MVEGLQAMRPRSQHIRRPPNRFLFGGWTYAGCLKRDIGKFPGFGRLPRPPCAARTLNDRDEEIIAGRPDPWTRGDKCIPKKGARQKRNARFRPIPATGIFSGLTGP